MASITYIPSTLTLDVFEIRTQADGTGVETAQLDTGVSLPAVSLLNVTISVDHITFANTNTVTAPSEGTASGLLEYTTDGGSSWITIDSTTAASTAPTTDFEGNAAEETAVVVIGNMRDLSLLRIRGTMALEIVVNSSQVTCSGKATLNDWSVTGFTIGGIIEG